jgi:hypothetical protein
MNLDKIEERRALSRLKGGEGKRERERDLPQSELTNKAINLLEKARITFETETPPLTPIIEIISNEERIDFGTLGNFSVIQGKIKAGKSFILLPLIASRLCPGTDFLNSFIVDNETTNNKVLYFDTEQGRTRTKRIIERLEKLIKKEGGWYSHEAKKIIDESLQIYSLREFTSKERFDMIEEAIKQSEAKLIIIDGIIDLIESNDKEEAKRISQFLMSTTEIYQCHILTIIHENKEGTNSRGDVGAVLDMKAESVYRIVKEGKRHEFIAHHTRDKSPNKINFIIEDELPKSIEVSNDLQPKGRPKKVKVENLGEEWKKQCLRDIFLKSNKQTSFDYQNLIYWLKQIWNESYSDPLGDNQAKLLISNLRGQGYVKQTKPKEPYFICDELLKFWTQ